MEDKGWVKIHRKILDNSLWLEERFTKAQAWIDLILKANHESKEVLIGYKKVVVSRGSLLISQVKLAKRWGWDRKTVKRFLKFLQVSQMVHVEVDRNIQHGFTVITIKNYEQYQAKGQQEGQESPRDIPSKRDTNKNVKNEKNIYIEAEASGFSKYKKAFENPNKSITTPHQLRAFSALEGLEIDKNKVEMTGFVARWIKAWRDQKGACEAVYTRLADDKTFATYEPTKKVNIFFKLIGTYGNR